MRGEGKGSAEDSLSGGRSPLTGPGGLSGRSASCGFAGLPFPGIALRDRGGWPAGRDGAGRGGRAIRGGSSAGLNATGGLVEESARMAPGGLFGGEDAPAAEGARGPGAPGERTVSRGGEAREADMRGEGSWSGEGVPGKAMLGAESVALSFAPRLLPPPACPSFPPVLSPFSALARSARPIPSPCPSRSSPSSFPLLPRVGFAFSRPSLCWTGFPCGNSRGKPCPPGLFGLAQPGPRRERSRGVPAFHRAARPLPAMDPAGAGRQEAARRPHGMAEQCH